MPSPFPRREVLALSAAVALGAGVGVLAQGRGEAPDVPAARAPHAVVVAARAKAPVSIVIGSGASTKGYTTKTVHLTRGGAARVVNHDTVAHTVTSVGLTSHGSPLFTVYVAGGRTVALPGVSKLAAGKYPFYCRFHPGMRGTLVVTGSGGGSKAAPTRFLQRLRVPAVITGAHPHIVVRRAAVQIMPTGPKTMMWTYGGTYPGPTISRPAESDTTVTFVDDLPASTGSLSVHLHGDHHSSVSDGQPTTELIAPGHARSYHYPLRDNGAPEPAAFDFYHDHRMGVTGRNNWNGLQGMFLVNNPRGQSTLPKGGYDVPLLVSDRTLTAKNQLTEPFPAGAPMSLTGPGAPPNDHTVGSRVLVDGQYAPYLTVYTHSYRLRLLNGSNFQSYDFELSDGRSFTQIGTGSSLLPKPVRRRDILLGPAQRADVIVSFVGELHHNVVLRSVPRVTGATKGIGTPRVDIMQFRVGRKAAPDHTKIPGAQTVPTIAAPHTVSTTWTLGQGGNAKTGTYWTINGFAFSPNEVEATVPLGATRRWRIVNATTMTHYVHLHEEQWHTLLRDGRPPPAWERGLEDTWRLDPGESIEVAARFSDHTGVFMIHCHMLDHEDHGMMAQFAVVPPGTPGAPAGYRLVRARPTPSNGSAMAGMSMP